jgi:magnesium and cobalt exporter, CNNM family
VTPLQETLISLAGMAVAVSFSCFFAGAEAALFSLSRLDIRDLGDTESRSQRLVSRLRGNPRRLLVTILFGNTVSNVAYFSLATAWSLRLAREGRGEVAVILSVCAVVVLILLGEITPKAAALRNPLAFARTVAAPLAVFQRAILPVCAVLETIARFTARVIGGRARPSSFLSSAELGWLIERGGEEGNLAESEIRMLREVLELSEVPVREAMTPRVDLMTFDLGGTRGELIALVEERSVPRILVHRGDQDRIEGFVTVADVIFQPDHPIEKLVRPLRIVPDSKSAESLLHEMRSEGYAAALVVDEYGGTEGLVTLEDLVEEIVGEIADELDADKGEPIRALDEGGWSVLGVVPLRTVADLPGGASLSDEEVDTIGGYVTARLGREPREGDAVDAGPLRLVVERVRGRSVRRIHIETRAPDADGATP